ncbi:MAG: hypothetical protein GY944_09590, partial [bacterium]|nr:hypothetical protein [bacterium]
MLEEGKFSLAKVKVVIAEYEAASADKKVAAIKALFVSGQHDAATAAAARKIDPKNEMGL